MTQIEGDLRQIDALHAQNREDAQRWQSSAISALFNGRWHVADTRARV